MKRYTISSDGMQILESADGVAYEELVDALDKRDDLCEFIRFRLLKIIKEKKPFLIMNKELRRLMKAPMLVIRNAGDEDGEVSIYKMDDGTYRFYCEQTYTAVNAEGEDYLSHNTTVINLDPKSIATLIAFLVDDGRSEESPPG